MNDYIGREAAKWHLYKEFIKDKKTACKVFRVLKSIPAADVVEVRHGRWKGAGMGDYYCSLCQRLANPRTNYCPNCGAKMDGGVNDA